MLSIYAVLELIGNQVPEHFQLIFELGLMIIIAGLIGFILKLIKQPLILAYVIAGIILGPLSVGLIKNNDTILVLSEIGVAFLLFFAGMDINFKKLKEVGKTVIFGGLLQIAVLFTAGFYVSLWLGLTGVVPIYVGLVVAFSSTMIVLKLLTDKREINSLHGRIIIGILLIQDIVAIIALTILTTDLSAMAIGIQLAKAFGFVIVAFILAKLVNPIFKIAARSTELLLLVSVTLLFIFAIASYASGLSLIIGAFFAGVALANSDYKTEIQGKIMPLRDFFAVLFFVALGMQITFISSEFVWILVSLIGLVLILKPLIIMSLVRLFGFSKRTAFLSGNALAQTSEFSLIIATIGFTAGYLSSGIFSTLVLLTIITMTFSTYLIEKDKHLYWFLSWPLSLFEGTGERKKEELEFVSNKRKKIVIFGCHRIGSLFLKYFGKEKGEIFVVDFNPDIIKSLVAKKVPCIYGDFANDEILEKINLMNSELVVSTIPNMEDNASLIKKVKNINKKVIVFVTAESIDDAMDLYSLGADYVLLPKVITGETGFHIIKQILKNKKQIKSIKSKQIRHLKRVHTLLHN